MAQAGALFTTLPTELFDNILDRVSSRHTLAALSCTSRAFARHTCPRLYSRIHLHLIVGDPKKPHFRLEPHLLPSRLTLANATFIEAITVEVDDFKRHDGEGKVMSEPILELFWKIQQCNAMGGGRSRLRSFTWESKICPWEGILECLPYGIRELVFPYQHTLGKVDAPGDGGKCLLGDHATEEDSSSSEETPWHGCRCSFAICKCFIKLQHLAPEVHSLVLKGVRTPPAMEGLGKFLDRAENLVSVAMGTASKCVYHKVEDCSWIACAMRRFSKVKRLEMLGVSGIGDIKALELGVERLERLESLTLEEIFIPRLVMANIIPSIFSALIQSNKRGKGLVLQELKVIITYKTYDEITQFLRAYRGLKRVSLIADYFPEDEPNEGAFLWDLFSALVESHSHSLETFSLASSSEEWACIDEDCMSKFMPNLRKLKVLQQLGLESSIIFNLVCLLLVLLFGLFIVS